MIAAKPFPWHTRIPCVTNTLAISTSVFGLELFFLFFLTKPWQPETCQIQQVLVAHGNEKGSCWVGMMNWHDHCWQWWAVLNITKSITCTQQSFVKMSQGSCSMMKAEIKPSMPKSIISKDDTLTWRLKMKLEILVQVNTSGIISKKEKSFNVRAHLPNSPLRILWRMPKSVWSSTDVIINVNQCNITQSNNTITYNNSRIFSSNTTCSTDDGSKYTLPWFRR